MAHCNIALVILHRTLGISDCFLVSAAAIVVWIMPDISKSNEYHSRIVMIIVWTVFNMMVITRSAIAVWPDAVQGAGTESGGNRMTVGIVTCRLGFVHINYLEPPNRFLPVSGVVRGLQWGSPPSRLKMLSQGSKNSYRQSWCPVYGDNR